MKQPPYVCHVNENIEGAVYIGRENGRKRLKRSKWHNPYKIERGRIHPMTGEEVTRADVIKDFRWHLAAGRDTPRDDIAELTGKPLACWCRRSDEERTEGNMCHGDVLVELWKETQP